MGMRELLREAVDNGQVPGAVALVARGDDVEFVAVGAQELGGSVVMARESIFRIASITKPVTAAAVMLLVEDGRLALDDPIARWLPELAAPVVVRTPTSPVDDVVPANRPITVFDLLTSRAGYGWPDDWSYPAVQLLSAELGADGREVQAPPPVDEWMARLAGVPMLFQPGERWLYNHCSDLQGVLVARVTGSFPDFLAERVFARLGMVDTGFVVTDVDRMTSYYQGGKLADPPDGQWRRMPAFPSGAGGLVSTVDDLLAFHRALLGDDLLTPESVRLMTTNHLTEAQREASRLFLDGQGWGFGGGVDMSTVDPWRVPGRYGWVGGTGTSAYVTPSTGSIAILLTQVGVESPEATALLTDFWTYSAGEHR
ncbi:serine hydrolase domain-containing protein [Kibdelosporangium lantanae]